MNATANATAAAARTHIPALNHAERAAVARFVSAVAGTGSAALPPSKGWGTDMDGVIAPMKRYPRRGRVSTSRGLSAESPRASRRRLTPAWRPCSKSTNVSEGHSAVRSSSRVTNSPGRSKSIFSIWKDWPGKRRRLPCFRSSWVCKSASNGPKRVTVRVC